MELTNLTALSPLDGRYYDKTNILSPILSEFGLIKARCQVEIEWLIYLAKQPGVMGLDCFNNKQIIKLQNIYNNFTLNDAKAIKEIEKTTNHDVKAVEYFLRNTLAQLPEFKGCLSFIHFTCTSEDINNLSYALMLKQTRQQVLVPEINKIINKLSTMAKEYASKAMLARTHGQSASPTTMGKELINFADRLQTILYSFEKSAITGKLNGAVGNFNAHKVVYENVNWPDLAKQFICNLGLTYNAYTTQINPHDDIAEYCHHLIRLNNVLLDLAKDIWGYIALHYFSQKIKLNEVGSSTMPHKINPIDFENAEGNLGLANALLEHFCNKLPISRWQRDLSDSTVLRNLGSAFGYCILAYQNLTKGLDKLVLNENFLSKELSNHWEVLAEPVQTVMRRYGINNAYELLKDLTRGTPLNQNLLHEFINSQALPSSEKTKLLELTPDKYIGYAEELVKAWNISNQ